MKIFYFFMKLFFKWGIEFDKDHPYVLTENAERTVHYASKDKLINAIRKRYGNGSKDADGNAASSSNTKQSEEPAGKKHMKGAPKTDRFSQYAALYQKGLINNG